MMTRVLKTSLLVCCYSICCFAARAEQLLIAEHGEAQHQIHVAQEADKLTLEMANELAKYLGKITGAEFSVSVGGSRDQIAVGTLDDFPDVPFKNKFKDGVFKGGDFVLRTHAQGLWIIGNSPTGVQNGVADFLYRLGYRHYFPHEIWEIVPRQERLQVELDVFGHPDYQNHFSSTSLTYKDRFDTWRKHNCGLSGFVLTASHIYQAIIRRNKEVFEEHPEYLALVNGKRQGTKFCISNPDLRKFVAAWACQQFQKNPHLKSLSMEPSDGGGWCECEDCAKLGAPNNRAMILANQVAEAVNNLGLGEKYIGLLAYHYHCAPPDIKMHPQVAVRVTTSMHTGGWDLWSLLEAWGERNPDNIFGISTYMNNVSSKSLPGKRLDRYAKQAARAYGLGARMAGNGYSVGTGGVDLPVYMAARAYWDIGEAERVPEIYAEFLDKCFGAAREPMDAFYSQVYQIEGKPRWQPLFSHKIGKMYRALNEALTLTEDPYQLRRIYDMILYTRYCELYLKIKGEDEVKRAADFYHFVYRTRERSIVSARQLFTFFPLRSVRHVFKAWSVPYSQNPWKNPHLFYPDEKSSKHPQLLTPDENLSINDQKLSLDEKQPQAVQEHSPEPPYSEREIRQILAEGLANNPVLEFETEGYSKNYVPASRISGFIAERPRANRGLGYTSGLQTFYTWVDKAPAEIKLKVTGAISWPNRGPIKVSAFSDQAGSDEADFLVTQEEAPADKNEYQISLKTAYAGLHRLEVSDGGGRTRVLPASDTMAWTVDASIDGSYRSHHLISGYFYIPPGIEKMSFRASASRLTKIYDAERNMVFQFQEDDKAGYFTIDIPQGQDGKIWLLESALCSIRFLNVPGTLASTPEQLLIPSEMVE